MKKNNVLYQHEYIIQGIELKNYHYFSIAKIFNIPTRINKKKVIFYKESDLIGEYIYITQVASTVKNEIKSNITKGLGDY